MKLGVHYVTIRLRDGVGPETVGQCSSIYVSEKQLQEAVGKLPSLHGWNSVSVSFRDSGVRPSLAVRSLKQLSSVVAGCLRLRISS